MELKPLDEDQVQNTVRTAIDDAADYVEADIAQDRLVAQRYYDGETDIGHEEGRSKVVATKARDVVNAIKPPLMRSFLSSGSPVEFIPKTPEDVDAAEQATDYCTWKFNQQNGYQVIHDAFHDALVKKTGVVKVYWSDETEVEIDEYSGLTEQQYQAVVSDEHVEILEETAEVIAEGMDQMTGEPIVERSYDLRVSFEQPGGDIKIEAVPPEDFLINSEATSVEDAYITAHRNADMRVGDLVAMGYSFDDVIEHAGDEDSAIAEEEQLERQGTFTDYQQDGGENDPSMRKILVTEAYMRVDIEGTGVPSLYWFLCVGSNHTILDQELADQNPFCIFETQREPHTFYGKSIVEQLIYDQDFATSMLRGLADNTALTNNPGLIVLDGQVNTEDLLNNEIGSIKRVKSMDAIRPFEIPPTAQQTLPTIQYFDEVVESKTGISKASMGLDADAMQNTSATAVNAMNQAATGRVELFARNLAEGGMKQLFKLLLKLTNQHVDEETMMRVNGQFVPVDPRSWNSSMDMAVNVGLGTGGEVEKEAVLRELLQHQMQIWSNYGPQNGLVTMTGIRATMAEIAKLGGIHSIDKYINPMDPQTEQMLIQQQQQAAQQQGQGDDPNAAFLQAEQMKATSKQQTDMARLQLDSQKAMAEEQRKRREMQMDDDRERDEMAQELAVKVAEILGQYGTQVDVERVRAEQAKPRDYQNQG